MGAQSMRIIKREGRKKINADSRRTTSDSERNRTMQESIIENQIVI
jgi:hypothetical protein